MNDLIMMVDLGHILKVKDSLSMHQNFINSVKRELRTTVSVRANVLMLSRKNKKNSSFLHAMTDTVAIFLLRKQKSESKMVRNTLSDSRYQKQKSLFSMISYEDE